MQRKRCVEHFASGRALEFLRGEAKAIDDNVALDLWRQAAVSEDRPTKSLAIAATPSARLRSSSSVALSNEDAVSAELEKAW